MTAAAVTAPPYRLAADDDDADATWAALAPLLAARPTMRLWTPGKGFADRSRLTPHRRPDAPAAVYVFRRYRTRVLVFDLDAKRAGAAAVLADRARLMFWLSGYGARFISDRSTSAGAHVIVPLARAVTVDEVAPFMRAAAALYPSLDIKPMLNPAQGCISVPGSVTREGGVRVLDGDLDTAVAILTERNHPELFSDLVESIVTPRFAAVAVESTAPVHRRGVVVAPPAGYFDGDGDDARLLAVYRRTTPLPGPVRAFAESGKLPAGKRSPSEARQAVLTHACWRGYSLAEVRDDLSQGPWQHGLARAYDRYKDHQRDTALCADWAEAQRWVAEGARKVRTAAHRKKELHTGGEGHPTHHPPSTAPQRRWLAHALAWCDTRFRSDSGRWMKAAVLQAVASGAAKTGKLVNGVPVVRVGGRSLSIGAGLVSPESVWAVLRELRETPGSPLLLTTAGTGHRADAYALVLPDVTDPHPDAPGRPELVDVHPVWSALGLRYRRAYEVLRGAPEGLHTTELATAARMSRSSTYEAVSELARVGLITCRRGHISCTALSLDQLGEQLGVFEDRAERITEYRARRAVWHAWLLGRGTRPTRYAWTAQPPQPQTVWTPLTDSETDDYLDDQMRTGPPPVPV